MKKTKLLFVEDDASFAFIIKECLELTGRYEIMTASNGKEGLEAYESFMPEIIASDVEMPVMNGFQMVQTIRQKDNHTPILFTTGRTKAQDVLEGYKLNVDNFIKKPFIPDELDAHIQAILKRVQNHTTIIYEKEVHLGEYTFCVLAKTLKRQENTQKLTPRETELLWMLYEKKGEIVTRAHILENLWGISGFFTSRSLDVFVSSLRKYLSEDPNIQIETVHGQGLKLTTL